MNDYIGHNTNGVDCWCNPTVETLENGIKVIIHHQELNDSLKRVAIAIATSQSTAEMLRRVRKARSLSILDVAEKTGLHRNYISGIERGDKINRASISAIAKIAHALNCEMKIDLLPFEVFGGPGPNNADTDDSPSNIK